MPSHSHGVSDTGHTHGCSVTDPGHAHTVNAARARGDSESGDGDDDVANQNLGTNSAVTGISVSADSNITGVTIQNNGSDTGHSHGFSGGSLNMQINYVDVIIAQKD